MEDVTLKESLDSPKALAPLIYNDGLKPSLTKLGKAIGAIIDTVTGTISLPFEIFNARRDAFKKKWLARLEKQIASIPEDLVIPADPQIVEPIFGSITYSTEAELIDAFAILISNASDKRFKDTIHPSFAHIVKMLTGYEARLLREIYDKRFLPTIYNNPLMKGYTAENDMPTYFIEYKEHYFNVDPNQVNPLKKYETLSVGIENLQRLGLITFLSNDSPVCKYHIEQDPFKVIIKEAEHLESACKLILKMVDWLSPNDYQRRVSAHYLSQTGVLFPTDFGHSFIQAVRPGVLRYMKPFNDCE